jgi:hypothetical protein
VIVSKNCGSDIVLIVWYWLNRGRIESVLEHNGADCCSDARTGGALNGGAQIMSQIQPPLRV